MSIFFPSEPNSLHLDTSHWLPTPAHLPWKISFLLQQKQNGVNSLWHIPAKQASKCLTILAILWLLLPTNSKSVSVPTYTCKQDVSFTKLLELLSDPMRILLCTWQSSVPILSCRFLHFWKKVWRITLGIPDLVATLPETSSGSFAKTKKMQDLHWNIKALPIPQRRGVGEHSSWGASLLGGFPSAGQRWSHCPISSRLCLYSFG